MGTAYDGTQIFFLNVMINTHNPYAWNASVKLAEAAYYWHPAMLDYEYNTAEEAPYYRYYIAAGTDYAIMMSPKFYTKESEVGIFLALRGRYE